MADNLSYQEIVTELDGIVTVQGKGAQRRIVYAEQAQTSAWYMRSFLFVPVRGLLGAVFGRTQSNLLENAAEHVRELLLELPDETSGNLLACANATSRCGWIAELDGNGQSRIVAIDGLVALVGQLQLQPFEGSFEQPELPVAPDRLAAAKAGILVARPAVRGEQRWDEVRLQPYLQALLTIVQAPDEQWSQRLLLVEDLTELYQGERDERVRPAVATALRQAIRYCVHGILSRAVQDRDPRFVEVRLCAMEQVRRLGGPRTVPLLLAMMGNDFGPKGDERTRLEADSLVQLRLIHYCGQLRGALADQALQLPGHATWEPISPAEFLAKTILNEQDYYSKLRTPALAALSWCLGRPRIDPDPAWVSDWLREQERQRRT